MNNINPKINIYQANPGFKAASALPFMPAVNMDYTEPQTPYVQVPNDVPTVELPDIYYSYEAEKKKESVKDAIKKADIMDLITPWFEHPLMMLATCFGINWGIDKFSKSCNKEYEKSILGKAAKLGDNIENSKAIQNKPVKTGLGWIKNGWQKTKEFAMKSKIISAMVKHPTMPENPMPKSEILSTEIRSMEKFAEAAREFGLVPAVNAQTGEVKFSPLRLNNLSLSKEVIEGLQADFGVTDLSKVAEEKVVARHLMKQAGFAETEIASVLEQANPVKLAKEKLIEQAGGVEKFQKILNDTTGQYRNEILDLSKKWSGLKIKQGKKVPLTDKRVLTSEFGFQEVYNRLHSLNDGAKTATGKFMSKLLQKVHRGFTFGGTKAGVMLFVAPLLVRTFINTHKADKKEKVGTFANGLVEAVSWVFTFPLILKAIHAVGGIKNAGVSEENLKKIDELLEKFNKNVREKADGYDTFKGWKEKLKELRKEIKKLNEVEGQGFITRTLRKISAFAKSDLKKPERFKDSSRIKNLFRNGPAGAKNFIWSAGRFMVFMMVGIPIVDKIITKCTDKIFGHHYDGIMEKENEQEKAKQEDFIRKDLQDRMYEAQARKMGLSEAPSNEFGSKTGAEQAVQPLPPVQDINKQAAAEQLKQAQAEQAKQNSAEQIRQTANGQPEQIYAEQLKPDNTNKADYEQNQAEQTGRTKRDNYTYIPSQDNVLRTPAQAQVNKYIPSQLPGNVGKTFDNSGLEAALRRADRAEARAVQVLSGKFPA